MNRVGLLAGLVLQTCSLLADAANAARPWVRDPAISPDGRSVAFRHDGDLYVVSLATGRTRTLRATAAHETAPVWLANSLEIAFAGDDFGNHDVFVMRADGSGTPRRLTWHPYDEMPIGVSPDGATLLVRSARVDFLTNEAVYVSPFAGADDFTHMDHSPAMFSLPLAGGMLRPLLPSPVYEAAWNASGTQLAYSVRAGAEHIFRKHERSPATWDIWLRESETGKVRQLTSFNGHDTTPVWNRADGSLYYLSERSGSLNVWRMGTDGDRSAEPVTHHILYPVRDLTVSVQGSIAYSHRGDLYAGAPGAIQKIDIGRLPAQIRAQITPPLDLDGEIQELVPVSGTREVVVIARGEVYVLDETRKRRRQLFAEHEGAKFAPTFSADGRRLLVVHDAGSSSDLLLAEISHSVHSWLDASISIRRVGRSGVAGRILRAALSPQGTQAAFATATALYRIDVPGGHPEVLLRRADGFGRPVFVWHPDGRHLALQWSNGKRIQFEIAVLDVNTRSVLNVSRSGFEDTAPRWSRDGRALVYLSDRDGLRNFQLSGGTVDAYAFFLDSQAQRAYETGRDLPADRATTDEVRHWLAAVQADVASQEDRRVRLSSVSAPFAAVALAPSHRSLITLQHAPGSSEVWLQPLPEGEARRLARWPREDAEQELGESASDSLHVSDDGRQVLVAGKGRAYRLQIDSGNVVPLELKGVVPAEVRRTHRWIFEHVVRTVASEFYAPELLPRLRWADHVAEYRRHLAVLTHPADFAELMSELLGELNASHTYFHYRRQPAPQNAFSLGVVYEPGHAGPGWKLAHVLRSGPLAKADPDVRAGELIVAVDGNSIPPGAEPAVLLAGRADREPELTVRSADGAERRVRVRLVDGVAESRVFYRRWAQFQAREAERLSNGRVGYLHMPAMEEEWFRPVIEQVLGGLIDRDGILLDTRFNVGGWIHEPLLAFFAARHAFDLRVHGTTYASEPALRAGRPLVVLVNRANYSNGFETPRLLREQGIARLVGDPMAGTGLGGNTDPLPYPQYSYSVAHDLSLTLDGEPWEGAEQAPDVLAPADANTLQAGRDVQLEAAVRLLLERAQHKLAQGCEMGGVPGGCSNAPAMAERGAE